VRCCGYEELFDARMARKDAERYRRKGLRGSARRVLELARGGGLDGADVLEIGGGVGSLSIELVRAGAAHATVLELSSGYDEAARSLLHERGVEGRVEHRLADLVEDDHAVGPADVVVMERVVCCYPDVHALVGAAARRAGRRLVLSYPRYSVLARAFASAANLVQRLRRQSFRVYAHPPRAIQDAAAEHGLTSVAPEDGLVWRVIAFDREYAST
jgi:2-polyprenyl-3-methyl-5-hydroxy-6-metoxy-1,4-benzoquinol methylase